MNTLDYFIVCILVAPTVTGIFKGFIRTVLGLLGIIGGIVLSMAFARPLGVAIGQFFGAKDFFVGKLLSFIIIFFLDFSCRVHTGSFDAPNRIIGQPELS